MSRILTILRAAHCRSTHHYFALDALRLINTECGGRLGDLLLKHYDKYLQGAKDPDKKFKDFQNHVLHVGDSYWGGAPRACEKWLKTAINHLNNEQWEDAAYDLGVLSHYFTDPLMPLHTGSSESEGPVHRPMEWSVCKSYEEIYDQWMSGQVRVNFELAQGAGWIGKAVTAGAEESHKHYDRIIEIYDLQRGVKRPPEGLNSESREILSEMFGIALVGWARILERVAQEASVTIPQSNLSIATVVAMIDMPVAWIVKKVSSVSEQRALRAIFKEYQATGTVRVNLPPEIRAVRAELAMSTAREQRSIEDKDANGKPASIPVEIAPQDLNVPVATESNEKPVATKINAQRKPTVSEVSDLVDAPSIGPKTAKRFEKIGITTIGQFVAADAGRLARKLATRWIKPELVAEWQDQARLVCRIPSLCGYKSQLLVDLECRTVEQLAEQDASTLASKISVYADSKAGQRILRSSSPPDLNDVACWISDAQEYLSSRAA